MRFSVIGLKYANMSKTLHIEVGALCW